MVLLQRTGGTDVGFCGLDLMLENGYLTARLMRAWPGNALAIRTKAPIPAVTSGLISRGRTTVREARGRAQAVT